MFYFGVRNKADSMAGSSLGLSLLCRVTTPTCQILHRLGPSLGLAPLCHRPRCSCGSGPRSVMRCSGNSLILIWIQLLFKFVGLFLVIPTSRVGRELTTLRSRVVRFLTEPTGTRLGKHFNSDPSSSLLLMTFLDMLTFLSSV